MSTFVAKKRNGKIKVTQPNKSQILLKVFIITSLIFTFIGFFLLDYKDLNLMQAIQETFINLKIMFLTPTFNQINFAGAAWQVFITLCLAFLSTIIGAIISLFLAFGTSMNLSKPWLSYTIKSFVTVFRAVPTVLWVLIFAIAAGLGSIAAIIGMVFHSISYLVKAYSEAFEELDKGKIEALQATGASYTHILSQVVIPQTKSYIVSWTFLRFEINFGVAVAMGAAAGAGGIGYELFMASNFYFDLNEVGAITLLIIAVSIILEIVANQLKAKA
ncbi:PhnE/PtxC family ABC transporter permease [Staphylococcus equorum]|uniref:PhnE/PtxC family ABC transporter permease n=1 Tax=Staphylococcus equorum TaxID=246432 RepID=UPI003D806878